MESRLINCDPISKNAVLTSINITQNDLDKLVETNAKYGEKNTKYFLGLEKRNRKEIC